MSRPVCLETSTESTLPWLLGHPCRDLNSECWCCSSAVFVVHCVGRGAAMSVDALTVNPLTWQWSTNKHELAKSTT